MKESNIAIIAAAAIGAVGVVVAALIASQHAPAPAPIGLASSEPALSSSQVAVLVSSDPELEDVVEHCDGTLHMVEILAVTEEYLVTQTSRCVLLYRVTEGRIFTNFGFELPPANRTNFLTWDGSPITVHGDLDSVLEYKLCLTADDDIEGRYSSGCRTTG